ncbi:hypothetical protein LCGC14_0997850 [marine sediment metagenome]|uniref:Uncharacterized protein n=1 Tax=marine sediment metagenome TaxID=412755 RepID=A0A0F9N8N3_9ZZZZ
MPPETQGIVVIDGHICESSWIANKVTVGRYGADFNVIQDAIDYCDALGGEWVIQIYPRGEAGAAVYDEGDITPSGGAIITLKGMGEGRVRIAPTVAPATAVIVSGFNLTLENITVTAPDATMPALAVIGGTFAAFHCDFNGVGAGDSIDATDGTLTLIHCGVSSDIELRTNAVTINAWDTDIYGGINTAGAVAHAIELFNCDLGNSAMAFAATGACTYHFEDCNHMGAVTDASLLGDGHICRCHMDAGLTKTGTTPWLIDSSELLTVSNNNATGAVTIYGGILVTITRAIGPVVWWQDGNTLKVLPSGTVTDTVIQWAVNAAAAGDTVMVHPGAYSEAVTLGAGKNVVGIDKDNCILTGTDITLFAMAAGSRVANVTLVVIATGGNAIGIDCNDAAFTLEDVYITLTRSGGNAYGIYENTGATARVINLRNVRIVPTDAVGTNEAGIYILQAGKTLNIENSWIRGGDYSIRCTAASTFYVDHTYMDVVVVPPGGGTTISCLAATMWFRSCTIEKNITAGNLGTIRLYNCSYRQINRTGTGNIVDESPDLKDAPWHVQRWSWMATLAQSQVSVRGTPLDAGTGQILLQVVDDVADVEAVESGTEAAGALSNKLTPARTPRFITQIVVDSFDPHVTMFFGLRETLGDAVPAATEDHAGFIWDGANFKSSSDDGIGIQENNLAEPSTDTLHQLEVIVFGGVTTVGWVEFWVDGVLVQTHATRIPVTDLDWQHLLPTAGGGTGDAIDVTVRGGGVQQCPA